MMIFIRPAVSQGRWSPELTAVNSGPSASSARQRLSVDRHLVLRLEADPRTDTTDRPTLHDNLIGYRPLTTQTNLLLGVPPGGAYVYSNE
ncbi:hypothetical protein HDA40_006957 [Hamadaea flava]|nr:hypothetical protein [Hamadaea flava]